MQTTDEARADPGSEPSAAPRAEAMAKPPCAIDGWAGPANGAACALSVKIEEEQALADYRTAPDASRDPVARSAERSITHTGTRTESGV